MPEEFLTAYIECALWSSMDESTPEGGEPFDKNYGPDDLSPETLATMQADCERFWNANEVDIAEDPRAAGHDVLADPQRPRRRVLGWGLDRFGR